MDIGAARRRRRRPLRILVVALVFSFVALAACSASVSVGGDLDTDKLENEVEKALRESNLDGQVTCPDDVKGEAGATFECTARVGDETHRVVVTQKDDEGNVSFDVLSESTAGG